MVAGDQQTGPVGQELPVPLVVRATDDKGKGIKQQLVNFRVVDGGGDLFAGAQSPTMKAWHTTGGCWALTLV